MYIIGAVLEKEQSKAALYDKENNLVLKKEGTEKDLGKLCLDLISEAGIKPSDVAYVGVAVDSSASSASFASDVEKSVGVKCYGASLMEAKARGEAHKANDAPYAVALKIEDTVESGLVIDKKIYFGANLATMIIDFDGYECSCGKKGCFEAYASLSGLRRMAAEAGVENAEDLTHKALFAMKTPEAEQAKKLYVGYLASGITNIINLFQPNVLLLEGPFVEAGDALLAPMMDIVLNEQYTHSMPNKCDVKFSKGAQGEELMGAALLGK
ncbi:MAG: ROK family protein [Clostridia bacterium]|nr:ROK family protein [Clostridia bacterium]